MGWRSGSHVANATEIVINHDVVIPDGSIISIRNVILNGRSTSDQVPWST